MPKLLREDITDAFASLSNAAPDATMPELLASVNAARDCIAAGVQPSALLAEVTKLRARVAELEAAASAPVSRPLIVPLRDPQTLTERAQAAVAARARN